jgi:hypothetical protein
MTLGIDIGVQGALAVLDQSGDLVAVQDGPTGLRAAVPRCAAEVEVSLSLNNCSSGYLLAFIGAGLTSVATILAFSDLGELVAFFLAIVIPASWRSSAKPSAAALR